MFIDTHCHLQLICEKDENKRLNKEDLKDIKVVVDESSDANVKTIINISTSAIDSFNSVFIAQNFEKVYAAVAMHPCYCPENWRKELKEIEQLIIDDKSKSTSPITGRTAGEASKKSIVAIGETGLDFYHKPFFKQRQIDSFKAHLDLAVKHDLAVVTHIRESVDESLKVLEEYKDELRIVAHCFCQKKDIADVMIDWGFYFGIAGIITYPKNQYLRDIVKDAPIENIVVETDAPFLPPQQFRGKKNYPKYIPLIAEQIATTRNVDLKTIEQKTTENAKKLFGIT